MYYSKKVIRNIIPRKVLDLRNEKIKKNGIDIYKEKVDSIISSNVEKVSVIIPNYNYEKYIVERIDSILFQTYPIYELIILDDCSTDNSVNVIKDKISKEKNKNIKLVENSFNSHSVFSQWQKGFNLATGDFVWIAEADDSCNCHFLENVMKGFIDKNVVLSYAESMRINEDNKIILNSCRDFMLAASENHWDKNYINDGDNEVKNYLSICNTIPNVSAVVWKKQDINDLLCKAKKFTMSGDWYIYENILKNSKIAYCAKSLNYFRKHSDSTSSMTKKETELKELLEVQKDIRTNYVLNSRQLFRQSYRYGNMINELDKNIVNKYKNMMVKKIAWIIPMPIKGSGGIRTIITNANFLVKSGYICDVYVDEDYFTTNDGLAHKIKKYYGECLCDCFVGVDMQKEYDMVFATFSLNTVDYIERLNIKRKAYFIQDFEPYFEPMGDNYLKMERTYRYEFEGISIGHWLAYKLHNEYNASMNCFDFCADLSIYKKLDDVEQENAVCFIYQPEKPRRGCDLGIRALILLKKLRPDVKIYLYGSDTKTKFDFDAENLHIISVKECNRLYNKCKAGLCISSSNPSRIPFEMMSAGLPVVDLYRENNLYDIPDSGVLLADSTPQAIASALIKILDNDKLQKELSENGNKYMQDYPIEKGYKQFLKFVDDYMNDRLQKKVTVKRMYNKPPIKSCKEVNDLGDIIYTKPVVRRQTSNTIRKIVGRKKKIIKFLHGEK